MNLEMKELRAVLVISILSLGFSMFACGGVGCLFFSFAMRWEEFREFDKRYQWNEFERQNPSSGFQSDGGIPSSTKGPDSY